MVDAVLLSDLKSSVSDSGGSKKQHMRDQEEARSLAILQDSLTTDRCRFMTLEAGAQMGKSRMIHKLIQNLTTRYRDIKAIFVPAMDYRKNGSMTYIHSFVETLLTSTKDVASSTKDVVPLPTSEEFRFLTQYLAHPENCDKQALIDALQKYFDRVYDSDVRLLLALDDAQWIDSESANVLAQVISHNKSGLRDIMGIFATRRGDETISNQLLHSLGLKADERIFLKNLVFRDAHDMPVSELKEFVCDLLGFDLSNVSAADIDIADDVLLKIADLSEGNPGRLTGIVLSKKESKVLCPDLSHRIVSVDVARLGAWESAGDADSALVNEVKRLIEKSDVRTILTYIVAFTEMGECSWALMSRFIDVILKQPELNLTMCDLDAQGIARSGGSQDAVLFP